MKIIDFEKAKNKLRKKDSPEVDLDELQLEKECRELARFYEDWYEKHVVGQAEDGSWIYK